MGDLRDTDVVALARRFLIASTKVTEELGGEGRFAASNVPPYPMVRLNDPPGNDRAMNHLIAPLLQIEVLGDPGISGQKPRLRRAAYAIVQELARLPEMQATGEWDLLDDEPVVTYVESSGGAGYVTEPPNQPRYITTVRLYVHPR